jgi:hypothetical protein
VRREGTPGAYAYVVSKGTLGCDFSSYGLYTSAGRGIAFYVSDGGGYIVSPTGSPAQVWDGAWHHVAGTFDGQSVRLYLDGSQIGGGSPNHRPIQYGLQSRAPYIGTYVGGCLLGFTGDIDNVRNWELCPHGRPDLGVAPHRVRAGGRRPRRCGRCPPPAVGSPTCGPLRLRGEHDAQDTACRPA